MGNPADDPRSKRHGSLVALAALALSAAIPLSAVAETAGSGTKTDASGTQRQQKTKGTSPRILATTNTPSVGIPGRGDSTSNKNKGPVGIPGRSDKR